VGWSLSDPTFFEHVVSNAPIVHIYPASFPIELFVFVLPDHRSLIIINTNSCKTPEKTKTRKARVVLFIVITVPVNLGMTIKDIRCSILLIAIFHLCDQNSRRLVDANGMYGKDERIRTLKRRPLRPNIISIDIERDK
jgi:hypothetical protein